MLSKLTTDSLNDISNEKLLLRALLTSKPKEMNLLREEFKRRVGCGSLHEPMFQIMSFTNELAGDLGRHCYNNALKSKLFKDAIAYKKKIHDYENPKTNEASRIASNKRVALFCFAIEFIYGFSKLKEIDISTWGEIIQELKNELGQYRDQITEQRKQAARKLAMLLSACHINNDYRTIAQSAKIDRNRGGSIESLKLDKHCSEWYKLFEEYIQTLHLKSTKQYWTAFREFAGYIKKYNLSKEPREYLKKKNTITIWDYLVEEKSKDSKAKLTVIYNFTNWIIDEYLTDRDGEDVVTIGVHIFSTHVYNHIVKVNPNQKETPSESVKLAPPTSWLFIMRDILCENDFEWPKTVTKDYFQYPNKDTGEFEKIWIPVNAYLFLTMLEIPLRKIQVISSDSGEGDTVIFNASKKSWEKNTGVFANYWNKLGSKRVDRGIVSKLPSSDPSSAGLYINTNKTQDIDTGFSELSGYNVPWHNETLIKYFSDLRAWQEKYNPVDAPTKYKDIAKSIFGTKPTDSVLKVVPDRFYLFRSPNSKRGKQPNAPLTSNQINGFWMLLMVELEKRVNQMGENVEIVTHYNEKTRQPDASIFSPHSLRVAGLTAFAEAGVPIEVLSKIIAGHSNILMTIYYIKYNAAHITDVLNDAQKNTELNAQKNYQQFLKNATWEEAKRYAAYNSTDGLSAAISNTSTSAVWGGSSLGICPYGGTRCNDGGEIIRRNASNNSKHLYAHVPGGQGNCVRCRHFFTGAPWMIPLWLHGNKLLSDSSKQSAEIDVLKSKQNKLNSERYACMKEGRTIPVEITKEINTHDSIIEQKVRALDETLMNAHATYNLLEKVKAIASNGSENEEPDFNSTMPALTSDNSDISFDEASRFTQLDTLVQAGRIYTHIQDVDEERERNNFIDQILFNNSINPISFSPLSDEEKSLASDAAAKFLISRLESNEIENLHNGSLTLESLGITTDIEKTLSLISVNQTLSALPNSKLINMEVS